MIVGLIDKGGFELKKIQNVVSKEAYDFSDANVSMCNLIAKNTSCEKVKGESLCNWALETAFSIRL